MTIAKPLAYWNVGTGYPLCVLRLGAVTLEDGARMGTQQDMRRLAQSIVDSYEVRVKTVSALMKEAAEAIKNFQVEQEKAIARLRDDLARDKSLRKKDFDTMIKGLLTRR